MVGDVALQAIANIYLGQAYVTRGDHERAIECFRTSVACLEGELLRERLGLPYLPAVFARTCLGFILAEMGAFTEGLATAEEGVRIAEAVDHPLSRIAASAGVGFVYFRKGDLHQAIPVLEHGLVLSQGVNLPVWPIISSSLGAAYALSGRVADGLPLLEQAVAYADLVQLIANQALWLTHLGEAYLLGGRLEDANTRAEQALAFACGHQGRSHQAYALRLLGDIGTHRNSSEIEPAEAHYQQALALAWELGMRPLVAHCHRGLGSLYAKMRQREQARAELSTAIELYRAMDMTFWLPQAEAALARVEGQ
jgi:tetratricopeptide (TPR) repeat protein